MLSTTLLIPAARPLLEHLQGPSDGAVHAFMSVNMVGGALGAPLLAALADRTGARRAIAAGAALADAVLLLACSVPMPIALLLTLRAVQGAAAVGALSVLMGSLSGGRAVGIAGAASMAGVALGAPLGTMLLRAHPVAPLWAGALLALAVAAGLATHDLGATPRAPRAGLARLLREHPRLRLPLAWVTVERFAVGCMVVSFSLYAHRALGLDDARIGSLYGWFLFPFVVATYPAAALGAARPHHLVPAGLAGYAVALALLGLAPPSALPLVMLIGGLAAAAVYGPTLRCTAALAPPSARSTAMGLLHAGGSLGMLAGTATAGILSAALGRAGWGPAQTYPLVFALAALAQLVVLVASVRGLRALAPATRGLSCAPSAT